MSLCVCVCVCAVASCPKDYARCVHAVSEVADFVAACHVEFVGLGCSNLAKRFCAANTLFL